MEVQVLSCINQILCVDLCTANCNVQISAAGCIVEQLVQIVGNGNQNVGRRTMATFSSLIICQSVQIEITLSKTTKLKRRGDELQENKMQSLSRPKCQNHNLMQKDLWIVDVEKRKAEDLSEDGIGKNVLSTLRRGSGVVWGVNGVKYALLDDA